MTIQAVAAPSKVVEIAYKNLKEGGVDLSLQIEEAFGPDGNGIITVSGVPGFPELRRRLLPLAQQLALLSPEAKAKVEDHEGLYNFGWSHGKEKLNGGKPDVLKGSFYANPLYDVTTTDPELILKYPSYCRPNLWPKEVLPDVEFAFKELGRLIVETGLLLTEHCDRYVQSRNKDAVPGRLVEILKKSKTFKGRLLHYFPAASAQDSSSNEDVSSWCGWHTDHGSLTGLTSAMYTNGKGEEVPNPDPSSGLYIRNRRGQLVKAVYPATSIAYQMGEAMQIHSGGLLLATPHCVRAAQGPAAGGIARNTFALFMQPQWDEPMDLPPGSLPPEKVGVGQWEPGLDFGSFAEKTIANNYG